MTRQEKIEAIAVEYIGSINTHRTADEWIRDAMVYGRVGLCDMTDEEIDAEYELWVDGGIDAEIDASALAHEAATNSK